MQVDPSQAETPQPVGIQEVMHVGLLGGGDLGQQIEIEESGVSPWKIPGSQFTQNERVETSGARRKQLREPGVGLSPVIDPNRSID